MSQTGISETKQSALNFMNTLQSQQNTAFQGNQAALDAVSGAWTNILNGGAIPAGYSAGLDQMLQSNIRNNAATSTANAVDAAELQQRQASGGAPGAAPAGADQAIRTQIADAGQASENANLTAEKTADYQQGVANLEGATQGELGVATGENEVGLAGAATGSGQLGLSAAQAQWQENQTSSPAAILGDIGTGVGDLAGVASDAAMFNPNNAGSANFAG
jgi:hypothetical protein